MYSRDSKYSFSDAMKEQETSFRIKSSKKERRGSRVSKKPRNVNAVFSNSPSMSTNASMLYGIQNQSFESISSQNLKSSKPPRVPPLQTKILFQQKVNNRCERTCLNANDDYFFLNEYK